MKLTSRNSEDDIKSYGGQRMPCLDGRQDQQIIFGGECRYASILMRLSTLLAPGALQATLSACSRSAHDRTVPLKMILLPFASTVMRLASISAARRNPSSILRLISIAGTRGPTSMQLMTPCIP